MKEISLSITCIGLAFLGFEYSSNWCLVGAGIAFLNTFRLVTIDEKQKPSARENKEMPEWK